jgi:hypothetical protein
LWARRLERTLAAFKKRDAEDMKRLKKRIADHEAKLEEERRLGLR